MHLWHSGSLMPHMPEDGSGSPLCRCLGIWNGSTACLRQLCLHTSHPEPLHMQQSCLLANVLCCLPLCTGMVPWPDADPPEHQRAHLPLLSDDPGGPQPPGRGSAGQPARHHYRGAAQGLHQRVFQVSCCTAQSVSGSYGPVCACAGMRTRTLSPQISCCWATCTPPSLTLCCSTFSAFACSSCLSVSICPGCQPWKGLQQVSWA